MAPGLGRRGMSQQRAGAVNKPPVAQSSQMVKQLMESYNTNKTYQPNGRDKNEPSKDEKHAIKESEDEHKRRGLYKRVFPTIDFLYYK